MLNLVNPVKADLRQPVTAWKALVWAYADEWVRVATNNEGRLANTDYAAVEYDGGHGGGAINGYLDAHEDALQIDKKLRLWFKGVNDNYYDAVAKAVERRKRVPRACELPALRATPVRRANGTIKEEYIRMGRHDAPSYCLVEWQGCTVEELSQAQLVYDLFIAFLDIMPALNLSKWRITERGLDSSGRIIDKALKPVTG